MNSKLILGAGLALVGAVMGCGSSSGSGGSGGAGVTVGATVGASTTHAVTGAVTAVTTTTKAATTGAGGGDTIPCNPVVDTQCDKAGGFACDDNSDGTFGCYDQPANTADVCATCDYKNGPACKDGATCLPDMNGNGVCSHFCCTDADCGGAAGSCDKGWLSADAVGVCGSDGMTPGTTATGTTTGAGGGGNEYFIPQCTGFPATPASNGTCSTP